MRLESSQEKLLRRRQSPQLRPRPTNQTMIGNDPLAVKRAERVSDGRDHRTFVLGDWQRANWMRPKVHGCDLMNPASVVWPEELHAGRVLVAHASAAAGCGVLRLPSGHHHRS